MHSGSRYRICLRCVHRDVLAADIDALSHCRFDSSPDRDCIKVFISRSRYNTLLLSNDKCAPLLTRLSSPSREARLQFDRCYID